jgi:hypothetical protein
VPGDSAGRRRKQGAGTMRPLANYVDLGSPSRETRPTYHFMMKCLLYSRMETGLVSNQDFYDEDVNVYIAHLLNSFIDPQYIERSSRYLSSMTPRSSAVWPIRRTRG